MLSIIIIIIWEERKSKLCGISQYTQQPSPQIPVGDLRDVTEDIGQMISVGAREVCVLLTLTWCGVMYALLCIEPVTEMIIFFRHVWRMNRVSSMTLYPSFITRWNAGIVDSCIIM